MAASGARLVILDKEGSRFIEVENGGKANNIDLQIDAESAIAAWLRNHRGPLRREEIGCSAELTEVTEKEKTILDQLESALLVPIKTGPALIGILVLGKKLSGKPYGADDIALLMDLAHHAGAALENASLYEQSVQAERVSREREEKYRRLIESMPIGIFIAYEARLLFINEAFTTITGYTAEEIMGSDFRRFVALEDQSEFDLQIIQHETQNGISMDYELQLLHKDGQSRMPVNVTMSSFNYEGNSALMGIVKVVTEHKKREGTTAKGKEPEKLDPFKTALLASVSHELRTPLTSIKGLASTLVQPDVRWDEKTQRDFLNTINQEADVLTHLVNDLVQMAQLETGIVKIRKTECSLPMTVNNVREQLNHITRNHNFQKNIPADIPLIHADEIRIGEVITNLVSNAAAYSNKKTSIKLDAFNHNGKVTITVTDEGTGIPPEHLDKVFDRFYRLESGVASRKGGLGLGLSICKGIIEAHGGSVWVESEVGKGSKFTFSLPVAANATANSSEQLSS
ncbi:MAG: ATP-binding protein [Dehalococcoidia bacterium]